MNLFKIKKTKLISNNNSKLKDYYDKDDDIINNDTLNEPIEIVIKNDESINESLNENELNENELNINKSIEIVIKNDENEFIFDEPINKSINKLSNELNINEPIEIVIKNDESINESLNETIKIVINDDNEFIFDESIDEPINKPIIKNENNDYTYEYSDEGSFNEEESYEDNNDNDDENKENDDENVMDNNSLFALRSYYQEYYEDESDIIQILKTNLMDQSYSENETNIMLRDFYNSFGLNLNLSIFEEVPCLPPQSELVNQISNISNLLNLSNQVIHGQLNSLINSNEQFINVLNNLPTENNNIFNLINNIIDPIITGEDIVCTLNDEDKDKLNKYKLTIKLEQKCGICLDEMIEENEVISLSCEHTYHSGCINEYLEKYNYKCPNCRKEIGKPKYNL